MNGRSVPAWVALALWLSPAARGEVRIAGRVIDENGVAVAGARVTVPGLSAVFSDPIGRFTLAAPAPGELSFSAEREGFFALKNQKAQLQEGENEVTLVLNHQREFVEQVDVVYSPPAIDLEEPAS